MFETTAIDKALIINADDFGLDDDTTDATVELFERGAISSATIMVGMPASDRAIAYAREQGRRFSFGLHFNIVDGMRPLSAAPRSLVDASGAFRRSHAQRLRALGWLLAARDIEAEFEAQLRRLLSAGVDVSHIDSHGHLHKFPVVARALQRVMTRHGLQRIRAPQTLYQSRQIGRGLVNAYCRWFFGGALHPDHSFFISNHDDPAWLERMLESLPHGVTELAVHPGRREAWRWAEAAPLFGDDLEAALARHRVCRVSYWAL